MQLERNQSSRVTFILLCFPEYPSLEVPLFFIFLAIYAFSVFENLGLILVITINPKLHTPIYFFIKHLSFVDFCYTCVNVPKMLEVMLAEDKSISFQGCLTQFFFGCAFVIAQTFMLAVMAYDRFVAVCNPLLYSAAMSPKVCAVLAGGSYLWGGLCSCSLTHLSQHSFCGSKIINHFCCEHSAMLS